MIGWKKEEDVVEEASVGVTEGPAPDTTPVTPPDDDTSSDSQAETGPIEPEAVPDVAAIDANAANEDLGEQNEMEGYIVRYPNSPNHVHSCAKCAHNHAAGQFQVCQKCGASMAHPAL